MKAGPRLLRCVIRLKLQEVFSELIALNSFPQVISWANDHAIFPWEVCLTVQSSCCRDLGDLSSNTGDDHEIEVGCIYEINHINLPPSAPAELKFINVALVSEKSAEDVTLRFPNVKSVKKYFNSACTVDKYPDFDEEFLMGTALASRVLRRQVPFDDVLQMKSLWSFWFVNWFIRWGIDRPLNSVGEHEHSNSTNSSSSSVQGDESPKVKIEEEEEGAGEESENEISDEAIKQDDEAEESGDEETDATEEANVNLKRKRYTTSLRSAMKKAKVALPYNPIPELKLKAKLLEDIEDPALVDQVLEELDGELLPGGTQRLCWRRNAEGTLEYWLEDANLVNNRKEAGVNDPYQVPPPGWRLGDCSTQQISILKREVQVVSQSLEEFKKEVRAVMEEKFSMFSTLLAEIKKNQLVEKETRTMSV